MSNNIKNLVTCPHQVYKTYNAYWTFLLDSYEGGIDYTQALVVQDTQNQNFLGWALGKIFAGGKELRSQIGGNLFKHPKERQEDYNARIAMSYYYNFCAPIIDIYTDHLFKQPVIENFGVIKTEVKARSQNIDNKDGTIEEFRKEVADLAQIYGHIFVITDSPQFDGEVRTQKDLMDNNLFPYFTLHHPQNVINWALDSFGMPYWVVVREVNDQNVDPFNYDKENILNVNYRLWTRTEWFLYNCKYDLISQGAHNIGSVPITCIFDKQSKKVRNFLGISSIADISFIMRDVYNSSSELKQILRDQTFAILALQGDSTDYSAVEVGTNKGLVYPRETAAPVYVTPPSSNAETYFKHIDRQISKAFQLAKLEGGSVKAPDAIQQSGVSKAWDFNQTNSALSKKAGNLEDGETKLWHKFAGWLDKKFDGSITYPHEFSVSSLNEDLDEAEKAIKINLGVLFNKEIKKAIIKKKFPRMVEKDIKAMIKEMEAKEDSAGQGESGRILDRIPSLLRPAT